MAVKYDKLPDGRYLATIRVQCPWTKTWLRERKRFATREKAKGFAEAREKVLAEQLAVRPVERNSTPSTSRSSSLRRQAENCPTVAAWKDEFVDVQRERGTKPSWLTSQIEILERHIIAVLGDVRLDRIDQPELDAVLRRARTKYKVATNTRRNIGHVVKRMLRAAFEKKVIASVPTLRLPKQERPPMEFHRRAEYERLVAAATALDPRILAMVLLAGDAGLRCGEMVALEGRDLDFAGHGWLVVRHQERRGILTTPKSGTRRVPMTPRLKEALMDIKNLPGARVLLRADGVPVSENVLEGWLERVQKAAEVVVYVGTGKARRRAKGQGLHKLRHTFGSMAVKVMDVRSVQVLMGHANLSTTERYLHVDDQGLTEGVRALAAFLGEAS